MDPPIGRTPLEDLTHGEFIKYWALNDAQETVYLARKIAERDLFNLKPYKYSEKIEHMRKYRKELLKVLNVYYCNSK